MSLTNAQFDSIMRDYSRRQAMHRRLLGERGQKIRAELPRIHAIDEEIASSSVQCARQMLLDASGDSEKNLDVLKDHIRALGEERGRILTEAGYPADYLDMTYDCPDCKDTGFVNGEKCRCFRKAEIDLLYTQSHLADILELENFDTFSFDYYSDDIKEGSGGVSSLERIRKVEGVCRRFVRDFDTVFDNLFFYGDTGVGKTFLSHCIARELLNTTHSVIYFSAQELFEAFARKRFRRAGEEEENTDVIYDCDLLIIDDLGTELTNSFVNAELFLCINQRLAGKKSTIISTNLSLKAFADTYSERVFSRISNSYTMLKLFGKDIRLQKKVERKTVK